MDNGHTGKKGFTGLQVLGLVLGAMLLTALLTGFAIKSLLFAKPFDPVVLAPAEETRLAEKLDRLDLPTESRPVPATRPGGGTGQEEENLKVSVPETLPDKLEPEPYTEEGASREIHFSEREVNFLLAKNTDLARKMAIDLAEDLVSVKLLIPMDPDFPILGGKVLKVRAGAELAYRDQRPVVVLKGLSIMGVPMPNAWLGNLKNIDLVREFGGEEGFWKAFADGVASIQVREGSLDITLKE